MKELGLTVEGPATLIGDNQSSMTLAKNPEFHSRTKHVGTVHQFVREQVKPLARQSFQSKFRNVGLKDLTTSD